ncbi:MAG: hypothetical protein KGL51_00450 [Betaproteobacteria bacterium]|nr:hypothetical protein [Betaproteobacteria bacterium]MDE2123587.1 hypothetical protein [Betaproteobacteria bacterium]MDE2186139.1 hypothetical protein [Betaproteobacteria bacterium]MDE2323136.1 hypothetical protein [Betaproteobacteria bacterium]
MNAARTLALLVPYLLAAQPASVAAIALHIRTRKEAANLGDGWWRKVTPPQGEPRPVLDMVAHAVLTTYAVQRQRKAHSRALEPLDDGRPWE